MLARGGTGSDAIGVENEFLAVAAHPAYASCGVADHKGVGGDVFRDHGPCADEAVLTQRVPANDGGVRADRCAAFENRLAVFRLAADRRARVDDVGEDHARSEEHIVLAADSRIDGHVVLNLAVAPQHHIGRDNHVLPDIAVLAYAAARHDVREVPDFGAFPDLAPLIYIRGGVDEKLRGVRRLCILTICIHILGFNLGRLRVAYPLLIPCVSLAVLPDKFPTLFRGSLEVLSGNCRGSIGGLSRVG